MKKEVIYETVDGTVFRYNSKDKEVVVNGHYTTLTVEGVKEWIQVLKAIESEMLKDNS